ncbi:hypothetical protein JOM56_000664 [Amanita muscaria]
MFSMEVNNSTTNGNLQAIDQLLAQGGIFDPDDIDKEFYNQDIDHVVFVPGLFHAKMAAADALHHILVKPDVAHKDKTNLYGDITVLRPRETGIMSTKPGFRRMHQVITYAGISRRLDCWRVLAERKDPAHGDLDQFSESQPMLHELEEMAEQIVQEFCSTEDLSLERLKPKSERDEVLENAQLINVYLALYEELSYAMNLGDIGRVETCILTWIPLFKSTGKHIYATFLEQFLLDLHFKYPERLCRAIRYNILINPTGKPAKFRAVDWLVELHNLDSKVNHGGQGSNYTVKRIIEESSLIGTYKSAQEVVAQNFALPKASVLHAEPNMEKTLKDLGAYIAEWASHIFTAGRKAVYCVPNMLDKGHGMMAHGQGGASDEAGKEQDEEDAPNADDIIGELM